MRAAAVTAALVAAIVPLVALAATPAPKPKPSAQGPQRLDVTKLQPKQLAPTKQLHVEYTVEVNKLGQVARVTSVKPSKLPSFDAQTYGNALQAFIRTADGNVVLGTYRLIYDYNPKTMRVHRDVQLVKRGGVNPNAIGAADSMMDIARRNGSKTPPPGLGVTPAPQPAPSVNIHRMPDLPQVMKSPTPSH
ncbi:MAG TPA: hypothetical protein VGC96_10550 [Candidatus Elarobacter sp.]|jgi:hypothetical protein